MAQRIYGMYRCKECGNLFDEDDVKIVEESRGEYWGFPCYEKMRLSPCCECNFEDAYETEDEYDVHYW